ncbi:uncharacterized protein PADG_12336 [Paracoccidioides brasiliensis Pb18]|uniref:Uncharacterized protein n=1 Tax=Paracoccidioides brasiliensis (strain Pb18) TaxID=502780 RepID=A0A0A0HU70_PARBD|nr:uncharacterized protein PADG_12336 [Paracoccidioides brasiliensis Pb18]KGM91561.1 hypothetical protein PADG_12336 [Paracoccidioides brasiliensis Pb18]
MDVGIPSSRFYPLLVMKKRDWHSGTPLVRDDALSHRPADGLVEDGWAHGRIPNNSICLQQNKCHQLWVTGDIVMN